MAEHNGRYKRYVLDTSAVIAWLANEPGARKVMRVKRRSFLPFIVFSELYYVIWNKHDRAEADKFYGIVKSWGMPILQPTESVILNAGRLKAVYKLGIADSYIAAFALDINAMLVTKDIDFRRVKGEVSVYWL